MVSESRRWATLALVSAGVLLGMSLWFTASSVAPYFRELWGLSATQAAGLTTAVQFGFVAGTAVAAVLNLADLAPARWLFPASSLLAAAANGSLVLVNGFESAVVCRFLTGFFLTGVYPPGMKMVATWFRSRRGLAIGGLVGALTLGKATPYLIKALPGADPRLVVLSASAAAVLAAVLVAVGYRDGPHVFARRPFSWGLVAVVAKHRETRLATFGYLGHMWELYAMWTWIPAFLAASELARTGSASPLADLFAFATIGAGGLGCVWGGWVADRMGRALLVRRILAASGLCAAGVGFLFGLSPWILGPVALVWGFFVVADSAQFSALVTEVAPSHAVGTALTLQTSLGFLLSGVTIQLVPVIVEAFGWPWAFLGLTLGPIAGIAAMKGLLQLPRS